MRVTTATGAVGKILLLVYAITAVLLFAVHPLLGIGAAVWVVYSFWADAHPPCPRCRKAVDMRATICPYCRSEL